MKKKLISVMLCAAMATTMFSSGKHQRLGLV